MTAIGLFLVAATWAIEQRIKHDPYTWVDKVNNACSSVGVTLTVLGLLTFIWRVLP